MLVFIDGESTVNFIQDHVARFLRLQTSPAPAFHVLVANGQEIQYSKICK